jgi:hypothetical protein
MTQGLSMPDSASLRAQVVADVIELHLTWEYENLKHSMSPAAAINSFVGFTATFVPEIQSLAIAEFVGDEDTEEVRSEIANIVLKLVRWIVEHCVMLADFVTPQYLLSYVAGWYDEGVKGMWDIDTCFKAACQRMLHSFPEASMRGSYTEAPGLYSPRIMDWASRQLTWVNLMAGRLEEKAGMVPNHYGRFVQLFILTRLSLKEYLRHGQAQIDVARQLRQNELARAMIQGNGEGRA